MFDRLRKIGLQLFLVLVVVLVALAYVVYHIGSHGGAQPTTLIFLILIGFAFFRVLFRIRRKIQESESE
jgi:hypothetical protein